MQEKILLRPVWDWGEQFSERDIALFTNPLYKKPVLSEQEIEQNKKSKLPPSAFKLPGIEDIKKKASQRTSVDINKLIRSANSMEVTQVSFREIFQKFCKLIS